MDSLDKDKHSGKWSYMDLPDPAKGAEGYPRMLIENRAYCTKVFRKLHIELAHRQDGLQVQHCPASQNCSTGSERSCSIHITAALSTCVPDASLLRSEARFCLCIGRMAYRRCSASGRAPSLFL